MDEFWLYIFTLIPNMPNGLQYKEKSFNEYVGPEVIVRPKTGKTSQYQLTSWLTKQSIMLLIQHKQSSCTLKQQLSILCIKHILRKSKFSQSKEIEILFLMPVKTTQSNDIFKHQYNPKLFILVVIVKEEMKIC